jgi:Zn-dependent peptidase ImmA (M78 family)
MRDNASLRAARYAAQRLTRDLCITRPEQLVLEDIAMIRGAYVFEDELHGAEARLVRKGNHGVIRIRTDLPEIGRKRFAIAHELGHWELDGCLSQLSACTADDISGNGTIAPEIVANAFAGELLMPTRLMAPRCSEATPDLELVCRLAQEFCTTVTATVQRFIEESSETCVAVFSQDRKVKWWRAREGSRVWIERGQAIDNRSSAWAPSSGEVMEPVETEAWFPDWEGPGAREVQEQSMVLGHYRIVLTLLWLTDSEEEDSEEEDDSRWSRSIGSAVPSWKRDSGERDS